MHLNFSAGEILWTLTFAGLLVLLVVLLGRDRIRRFPWFTASMVMMTLRMVVARLLSQRMPQMTFSEIFLGLSDLASIISILVVVEIARRAFKGARWTAWLIGTVILLGVGGVITAKWGPWPALKTLMAGGQLTALRTMQLFAQKADLLADTLVIQLGLLVVLFGRRFNAGFRSHAQQIAIGLSTASLGQLTVRLIWQQIAMHTSIRTQDDYTHVMSLQEKFYNANNLIFLLVLLWWIACLWFDEPGMTQSASVTAVIPAESGEASQPATISPVTSSDETSVESPSLESPKASGTAPDH
jgi:hypothetical protein